MAKKISDISGRGVGLDVVKSKVESLSGEVTVKTKLGEGSTFTIRLPLTLAIIQALIDARLQTGMTQKELSEKTGIAQGDISKLERGNSNPSIRTLQRLAAGMGMSIQLKFIPNGNA